MVIDVTTRAKASRNLRRERGLPTTYEIGYAKGYRAALREVEKVAKTLWQPNPKGEFFTPYHIYDALILLLQSELKKKRRK